MWVSTKKPYPGRVCGGYRILWAVLDCEYAAPAPT
jgi:hypothetical protein